MPRLRPTAALVVIAVALLIVTVWPVFAGAEQPLPTPRGQLGGAEPLATEPAAATNIPVDTSPAGCNHNPVTLDELVNAASSTPPSDTVDWSGATAASTESIEAAEALLATLVDCANQNDRARAFSLYSPDGLARALARQGITVQSVDFIVARGDAPLPETARAQIVSIDDMVTADDDHMCALVTLSARNGFGENVVTAYDVTFARIDGDWLIDDITLARRFQFR